MKAGKSMPKISCFALVMLLSAGMAGASAVTFSLELFDNGTTPTPGVQNFAIYARDTADNGGLFSYSFQLVGNITSWVDSANGLVAQNPADASVKSLGFTAGQVSDLVNKIFAGSQDSGSAGTSVPIYGIGQEFDDLDNYRPSGYDQTAVTFGNGGAPYSAKFLLGHGKWVGSTLPGWNGLGENHAQTWVSRGGTETATAVVVLRSPCLGCLDDAALLANPFSPNLATDGAIMVSGSAGAYVSEVDELVGPPANSGSAMIATIGNEAGNVYVMAKLLGTDAQIARVLQISSVVGASDPQFAPLHAAYDASFGAGGFNALFKFPNTAGAKSFEWSFSGTTGVFIDKLAAVPEPGVSLSVVTGSVFFMRGRWRTVDYFWRAARSRIH
jgi:hypothetical protein